MVATVDIEEIVEMVDGIGLVKTFETVDTLTMEDAREMVGKFKMIKSIEMLR